MKTIKIKANKKDIDYYNQLLEVSFDDYSLKNKKKIDKLNALQNDYMYLYTIKINKNYCLTIDLASGDSNYYDNVIIWKVESNKEKKIKYLNEVACLDCEFELGNNIELNKEEFKFLDKDYNIVWNMA